MDLLSALSELNEVNVLTCVICVTVAILVLRLFSLGRASPRPLPPSPRFRLPILGHILQLNPDLRITFGKFRRQFGDVYSLYMGSRLAVVISGYATLKEAFKTRSLFVDRPEMYLIDKLTRKRGLVFSNGELWRDHRRFTLSTLKDFGLGRSILENRVHAEVDQLISEIRHTDGQPFDPKNVITTNVANIICGMAFGTTFEQGDEKLRTMIAMFEENLSMISSAGIVNILPFLAWIPGDPLKAQKVMKNSDIIEEYTRDIIEQHLNDYDEDIIDNYTSAYIKVMKQKERDGQPSTFTVGQLSSVIDDLFIGGSETTTTTLRWSLVCLVSYPETQTRMYDVIKEHVGTERLPSLKDKASLSYVEAFYMEVLRFCKLSITTGMYTTSTDVELNGYRIPQGCIVLPDLDSVLSDERIWGDPGNFRPERFLNEDGSIHTREEFIAFFIGKRHCLGEALARMELFLFLSAMVQNYFFEAPDGEDVSMAALDGVFSAVHAPKPFRIVARSRHAV